MLLLERTGASMHSLMGKTLGSFQVVERLEYGLGAICYKASAPALDHLVVLRVVPTFADVPTFQEAFSGAHDPDGSGQKP